MTVEVWRKVKAMLLLAMTAGAEVHQVQREIQFRAGPFLQSGIASGSGATSSDFKSMADAIVKGDGKPGYEQMEAMMKDILGNPSLQGQAKRFAEQAEALLADPSLKEQAAHFAKRMEAVKAEPSVQEQAFKEMEAELDFQNLEKHIFERMDAVKIDPEFVQQTPRFEKQAQWFAQQFEAMQADSNSQEQTQRFAKEVEELQANSNLKDQANDIVKQMEDLQANPNLQEQVQRFTKHMEELKTDPNLQEEAQSFVKQLEEFQADPSLEKLQEQAQSFFNRIKGLQADPNLQEHAQRFAKQWEELHADPTLGREAERFSQQVESMMDDPKLQEQVKQVESMMDKTLADPTLEEQATLMAKQFEGMMGDPRRLQEEAKQAAEQMEGMMGDSDSDVIDLDNAQDGSEGDLVDQQVDNLVDKLFERTSEAGPSQQEDLDTATLGKSSRVSSVSRQAVLPTRSLPASRFSRGGLQYQTLPTGSSWAPAAKRSTVLPTAIRVGASAAAGSDDEPKGFMAMLPPKKELKKMLPLASIFFCILFVYTVLRDTKDVLVVTSGGAEVIPFLKTYMNLPAAIGFAALYGILVNRMSNKMVFYGLISVFAAFFGAFSTIIYPNRHLVHPIAWATSTAASLPVGFGPLISIIKFWTFGLFYTMSELWGSVVVSLLFWGFANEICSVSEAKRWYPLFGLIANVALIFSGQFIRKVSAVRAGLPPGVDAWGYSLNILSAAVVTGALCILGLKYFMETKILTDPEVMPQASEKKKKKEKGPSMGLVESFKYLLSSSYIRNLAFLVIAYGMSINIVEVTWKGKLKQAFPDPNDYSSFMGAFSSTTGVVTFLMMIIGRWILTRFGWGTGALVTPIMLGMTGVGFFSLILFKDTFAPLTATLGLTPLMMAVFVGAAQNILSKSSKYSLFDPCKETAYIPLDAEQRTKGKAAIDVIGNPLGKSGGAIVQQGALLTCGSLAASTPFLAGVLFTMVGLWIKSAGELAVEFEEKSAAMQKAQDEDDASEGKKKS
jgi:AAA family ATP:ADP antiporter